MKKWVFISLFIISGQSAAASCAFTDESFSTWIMKYFQNPEPELLSCSLSYYSNSELFLNKTSVRMPMANFYASAINESKYESLFIMASNDATLNEKMFLLHVFWVADSEPSKQLIKKSGDIWPEKEIKKMAHKMLSTTPKNTLTTKPSSPGDLDNLWSIFFATGNPEAVKNIASVLHLIEDGTGIEIMVGGAARWSLTSNYRQYPEVKAILDELIMHSDGNQKSLLQEVKDGANQSHNKSFKPTTKSVSA